MLFLSCRWHHPWRNHSPMWRRNNRQRPTLTLITLRKIKIARITIQVVPTILTVMPRLIHRKTKVSKTHYVCGVSSVKPELLNAFDSSHHVSPEILILKNESCVMYHLRYWFKNWKLCQSHLIRAQQMPHVLLVCSKLFQVLILVQLTKYECEIFF